MGSIAVSGNTVGAGSDVHGFADHWKTTTGLGETIPRWVRLDGAGVLSSARLHLVAVWVTAGVTISNITFWSDSTAGASMTNQWFCLYDSALAKLAVTADDTSTAWAANTVKTLAVSGGFVTTYTGMHYVGICVVHSAGAVPSLVCSIQSTGGAVPRTVAPVRSGSSTTALTNPASAPATAAALTSQGGIPYALLT